MSARIPSEILVGILEGTLAVNSGCMSREMLEEISERIKGAIPGETLSGLSGGIPGVNSEGILGRYSWRNYKRNFWFF